VSAVRPISILIGALGGEGGGVLADWITRAAEASGFVAQRTSIPGVAQRTGATTYYLEISPRGETSDSLVLALSPVPGQLDLFVASELLEAGRAVQGGLLSADRTNVIASSHRTLTVQEKMAMSDGRFDEQRLKDAVARFSKRAVLFHMEAAARKSETAISAVMLGAIAGAEVLPIARNAFEQAIRDSGKGVEASLRGFAAGWEAAVSNDAAQAATDASSKDVDASGVASEFPQSVRRLVEHGYLRQRDYQNRKYADRYLERVRRVFTEERSTGSGDAFPVTEAVARFLALWMAYEDVIRVGDLKSRSERLRRIREEVGAQPNEPVHVVEYLKPGLDEWCAILPRSGANVLRRWAERHNRKLSFGLHLQSTSVTGFLALRLLASLRWWRPFSARFVEEQLLIERWLDEVTKALKTDVALAIELAQCGQLIKGYGDTHARGKANFTSILDSLSRPNTSDGKSRVNLVHDARVAALADPEGKAVQKLLGSVSAAGESGVATVSWHESRRTSSPSRVG